MGWRIHGRRVLLHHRRSVLPIFFLFSLSETRSILCHTGLYYFSGLPCLCMRSYSRRSGIKTQPNVLALSFLVSPPRPRYGWLLPGLPRLVRGMSSLSYCVKSGGVHAEVAEVVEVIRGEVNDLEPRLNRMKLTLSRALVHEVLLALNSDGISALCFFYWVLAKDPSFAADARINNLMIDNLGRLHDYGTMLVMLKELSHRRHCLTGDAFKFLTFGSFDSITESVRRVVDVLNLAGGSCCNSGIYLLIKLLCDLGSFHLAVHVMEKTARRTSYYNVLIAAKCRSGNFQDAYDLFEEMRKWGCDPSTKSYNYLLGSLFKNDMPYEACELLDTMEGLGYRPDSITFEVVTFHACRLNRMDYAVDFLQKMLSDGIMPRFTTHSAFIKGYFWSGRTGDAHKYVIDMSGRDKSSANMNYSLLANLSWKAGRFVEAGALLCDMMEKNLKPNFSVYVKVTKDLYKFGRGDLASDLKHKFSKYRRSD